MSLSVFTLLYLLKGYFFSVPTFFKMEMPQILPSLFSPPYSLSQKKVSQKEKRERCCSCLYVLSEPLGLLFCLLQSSSPYRTQPCSGRVTASHSHTFLRLRRPRGRQQTASGAPTEGPIVSNSVLSLVNSGRSPSSLSASLQPPLQKRANSMFINYLDSR